MPRIQITNANKLFSIPSVLDMMHLLIKISIQKKPFNVKITKNKSKTKCNLSSGAENFGGRVTTFSNTAINYRSTLSLSQK